MPTTYRFYIKTDSVRSRNQLAITGKLEVPRASLAHSTAVYTAFTEALARNVPDGREAVAWLEVNVPQRGPSTLRKFTGTPTRRNERGTAVAGVWTETKLGTTVEAGTGRPVVAGGAP